LIHQLVLVDQHEELEDPIKAFKKKIEEEKAEEKSKEEGTDIQVGSRNLCDDSALIGLK